MLFCKNKVVVLRIDYDILFRLSLNNRYKITVVLFFAAMCCFFNNYQIGTSGVLPGKILVL